MRKVGFRGSRTWSIPEILKLAQSLGWGLSAFRFLQDPRREHTISGQYGSTFSTRLYPQYGSITRTLLSPSSIYIRHINGFETRSRLNSEHPALVLIPWLFYYVREHAIIARAGGISTRPFILSSKKDSLCQYTEIIIVRLCNYGPRRLSWLQSRRFIDALNACYNLSSFRVEFKQRIFVSRSPIFLSHLRRVVQQLGVF